MKIIKKNYKLLVCFSIKEFTSLLLKNDFVKLINIGINNSLKEAGKKIEILAKSQSNLRDSSEFWMTVFGLIQEFRSSCEVCFLLKDTFNHHKNNINTVKDLLEFKDDPPDIIIFQDGRFYDFELKRYYGIINLQELLYFIKDKIFNYSVPYNFYVTLQPEKNKTISLETFEELSVKLKEFDSKTLSGIICFTFNFENKYIINVQVFPEYRIHKKKFLSGSDQLATIFEN